MSVFHAGFKVPAIACMLLAGIATSAVSASDPVAFVCDAEAPVSVVRAGAQIDAMPRMPLLPGDIVEPSEPGSVVLCWAGECTRRHSTTARVGTRPCGDATALGAAHATAPLDAGFVEAVAEALSGIQDQGDRDVPFGP